MRFRYSLLWAAVVLAFAVPVSLHAQQAVLELDPTQTQIEFTLSEVLHPVHGTFKLRSGTVRFNPATGEASGLVVVDAESEESADTSLDRKVHKDVLETRKYPEATFTPLRVIGRLEPQGESPIQLSGVVKLHGREHDLNIATTVRRDGDQFAASAHFLIPYVDWGLKNPSGLFVRVGSQVEIDVKTVGHVTLPTAPK